MPAAHVPKKFVKKKIIVDDGGKPNFPDKTIPTSDEVTSTAESKEDDALPPPPLDIDSLNDYVQSLSIGPVTVTIPATSAADPGAPVAVDGTHKHDSASVQPIAENIRNSFTFVPDGANEETVGIISLVNRSMINKLQRTFFQGYQRKGQINIPNIYRQISGKVARFF